ncbi:MAG: hypothetical protein JNJ99_07655 [Crocinitomicaceae bacterium]|nr:hypothetical protein [Crocinitomicaceae bacterium]
MKFFRHIFFLGLLLCSGLGLGQDLTPKAHALYQAKDYDSAKVVIDMAIQTSEKYNSQTWQLRGLIYRKLETPESTVNREIAIESFVQARKTDTTGIYKEKINEYLYNTIIRYYNDAVNQLNESKLSESEKSYVLYKSKYIELLDPNKNFSNEDLEYYNALGGSYSRSLIQLSGKDYEIALTLAVNCYGKVLAIDSMNYTANLNIAVMYYNKGADLILNQDPINTPIEQLLENIATAEALFLKALPLMKKAYALNPDNVETIEGLSGIYFGLNDQENYIIFQTKLDKINLPKYLEIYNQNPTDRKNIEELVRIYSSTLKDETQYQKFKAILDQLGG